ncbi:Uu.00g121060.m01.CDS01 [Anthostomella pinea]|uniref:Uu.00g121060.m01.CDS01 n=1 Tax=Anthostomella pinea TaxID=933095 RepID=A0AAI8YHE7_9PEZI|nr:Uu.00g121060.m01.CDS01 [Anthostomella pinea]
MTLLFNPELDILHVSPGRSGDNAVHLLHHLRAYDVQNVGLRNVALNPNDVSRLTDIDLSAVDPLAAAAFTDTIANLRQVFYMCIESAGRIYLGPRNGILAVTGFEMHRSRPIMPEVPTFDCVGRDPRPIAGDLRKVFAGTADRRKMVFQWRELLRKWQIPHNPKVDYRFLVAHEWNGAEDEDKVVDRESADAWLQREDKRWRNGQQRLADSILRRGGNIPVESPEDLEQAPRPAIGFWLFPVEALGRVPSRHKVSTSTSTVWRPKRVLDMRCSAFSRLPKLTGSARLRRTLFVSFLLQTICAVRNVDFSALAPVALLSFQAAGQIVDRRGLGVSEQFLAPLARNAKRNRRAVAFVLTLVGAICGGWISKATGAVQPSLWFVAAL